MKIAIIGGGAAGMAAAIAAREPHKKAETAFASKGKPFYEPEVILLERNDRLGVKVLLSGGGRCNLTTGIKDLKKVLENYPRGAAFLRTAMYEFGPSKVMEMFEQGGVKLKTEEDNRVFPRSDDGGMVVDFLHGKLKEAGVEIIMNEQALVIEKNPEGGFMIRTRNAKQYQADKVIITTGGSAYKQTGSTGDGYTFAEKLGHKITPLAPSLSGFVLEVGDFPAGVSFNKVRLRLKMSDSSAETFERTGPILFTHSGITGPAVFALSSMVAYKKFEKNNPGNLFIDLFPDEDESALEKKLLRLFDEHGKKGIKNILDMMLPHSFCALFLHICAAGDNSIKGDLRGAEIGRNQRKTIIVNLKSFPLKVTGRFAGEEFVTAGGVDLNEVDEDTMQSKIVPGLFFAGEILDIDGFTGGFNLQAAWATGYLAGKSAAKEAV